MKKRVITTDFAEIKKRYKAIALIIICKNLGNRWNGHTSKKIKTIEMDSIRNRQSE